jgi:hypothetical protein
MLDGAPDAETTGALKHPFRFQLIFLTAHGLGKLGDVLLNLGS